MTRLTPIATAVLTLLFAPGAKAATPLQPAG